MNKDLLVKALATETGGTQKDAKAHIDGFAKVIGDALKRGDDVTIKGFATFTSKEVAEGTGRNPKTGESVVVPAHRKSKATLAKALRKF